MTRIDDTSYIDDTALMAIVTVTVIAYLKLGPYIFYDSPDGRHCVMAIVIAGNVLQLIWENMDSF